MISETEAHLSAATASAEDPSTVVTSPTALHAASEVTAPPTPNSPSADAIHLRQQIAQAVIAAGGDIKLVAEKLTRRARKGNPDADAITPFEIMEAFLGEAATSEQVQTAIKSLMMLSYLELLSEAKSHIAVAMPSFSPTELIAVMRLVSEGMHALTPAAVQVNNNTQNNMTMFASEQDAARGKIERRLLDYLPKEVAE